MRDLYLLVCKNQLFAVFTPLSLKICAPYAQNDDNNDDAVIAFGFNNFSLARRGINEKLI